MPFLILFVLVPIAEVFVFLQAGEAIGILKTLLLCVLTAIIGGMLVKHQGMETLLKAQTNLGRGAMPVKELFDGFCLIIAGALLLTPGFVTDVTGFLLLFPPFRRFISEIVKKSGKFTFQTSNTAQKSSDSTIIEGDYEEVSPNSPKISPDDQTNGSNTPKG